jgi:Protein of unknown function (DUF4231)
MSASSSSLPVESAPGQVTLDRLQDQIDWYDRKSGSNQKAYRRLKICTMTAAALVPFIANLSAAPKEITAGLGVLIVVLEGLQQIYQYHANWISYRSTCEALKHEKYLYLAKAGTYAKADNPHVLLAEQVESLVSQENSKWTSGQAQNQQQSQPADSKG